MNTFNVIISPEAERQLNSYIRYIRYVLLDEIAAKRVYDDALETGVALSVAANSLQYCKDEWLRQYGYKTIAFRRHQYVMIYRVNGDTAYIDGIFHQKQDYENFFAQEQKL